MRSVVVAILVVCTITSSSGCAALGPLSPLRPLERSIVFAPSSEVRDDETNADGGTAAWFVTTDGVKLHGRFFKHDHPQAVVLYCHGNAGSLATWSEVGYELCQRHQVTALVFDYRGYGRSSGGPTETGMYQDARTARKWLAEKAGVPESEIVLMGKSLGGAVAVDLAANDGARGLILQSTFTSLPDVASVHLPWIVPHLMMTQRMNSAAKIGKYTGPLLQSHGESDTLIPIDMARKLHATAQGRKVFVAIPGAGHNDPHGDSFAKALDDFLDSLPPVETLRG